MYVRTYIRHRRTFPDIYLNTRICGFIPRIASFWTKFMWTVSLYMDFEWNPTPFCLRSPPGSLSMTLQIEAPLLTWASFSRHSRLTNRSPHGPPFQDAPDRGTTPHLGPIPRHRSRSRYRSPPGPQFLDTTPDRGNAPHLGPISLTIQIEALVRGRKQAAIKDRKISIIRITISTDACALRKSYYQVRLQACLTWGR